MNTYNGINIIAADNLDFQNKSFLQYTIDYEVSQNLTNSSF